MRSEPLTPTKRWLRPLVWATASLVVVTVAAWVAVESRWAEDRVRRLIVDRTRAALAGDLRIGELSGSVLGDVTLSDVVLTRDGRPVVVASAVRVRYRPWAMLRQGLVIAEVEVTDPRVTLSEDEHGWNVARLTRPRPPGAQPGTMTNVVIERLSLSGGTVDVMPKDGPARRLERVELTSRLAVQGGRVQIDLIDGGVTDADTAVRASKVEARVVVDPAQVTIDDIQATLDAASLMGRVSVPRQPNGRPQFSLAVKDLAAPVLRAYVPAMEMVPSSAVIAGRASGTSQAVIATWSVRSPDGDIAGTTYATLGLPAWQFAGDVSATDWTPAAWIPALDDLRRLHARARYAATIPGGLFDQATVTFDAVAPEVTYGVYRATGVRARGTYKDQRVKTQVLGTAYGAAVSVEATYDARTASFGASGRVDRGDLRQLPPALEVPALESALAGDFTLSRTSDRLDIGVRLDDSTVEGAAVSAGSTVRARVTPDGVDYSAKVDVRHLDPARFERLVPDEAGLLRRLSGSVNATVELDASGTTPDTLGGTLHARLTDSRVAAVTLDALTLRASVSRRRLVASVDGCVTGDFSSLRLADVADENRVTGSVVVAAEIQLPDVTRVPGLEEVTGSASVTITDASVRQTPVSEVVANVTLASGRLTVRTLRVDAPSASGVAEGSVVLAGPGETDLSVDLSLADLSLLDPLLGRTLGGSLTTSVNLSGTAERLELDGHTRIMKLRADTVTALSLDANFRAMVVGFDPARATGRAESTATFVEIGGTRIDEVESTLAYDGHVVDVDATLARDGRSLEFSGLLRPRPDDHEVLVRRLSVGSAGDRWTLDEGRTATVRYGTNQIALEDFVLHNGDARVTVDGALCADTAGTVSMTATDVDLSGLAIWLPGAPDLTGQLNGTATVGASPAAPRVDADLRIDEGSVNGAEFRAMVAQASYTASRLTLDVRLEAGTASSLTIVGDVPLGFGEGGRAETPFDLTVRSSDIDLAFFQPALPQVDGLRGAAHIDLRITGQTPEIDGSVTLADATFRIPATGVTYRGLAAEVDILDRQLVVRQMRLEDAGGHVVRIEGTANMPGVGLPDEFELRVMAERLQVLGNELGEVYLTTDLQVMGDLTTPLVVGTIRVDRGLVDVGRLLDRLNSGYEPEVEEAVTVEEAGPLRRASVSITLDMPDNTVIRGRDLRTAASGPIGLGDVNVTVGGALSIAKEVGEDTQVLGRMSVVRGQYQFQGRAFAIRRDSTVRFRGDPFDPSLDVEAERTISGVVAAVRLTGSPRRPEITLSSQPPLDQGDILSLIVFNQTMNGLPAEERVSLAARAGSLAAGSIASPIADSVARALNLDQFDIRPNETGASVLVGRQVNDRLFVGFRHDFGDSDVSQVSFEYRLNEFLRIVTSLAQGAGRSRSAQRADAAGFDLIFVIR